MVFKRVQILCNHTLCDFTKSSTSLRTVSKLSSWWRYSHSDDHAFLGFVPNPSSRKAAAKSTRARHQRADDGVENAYPVPKPSELSSQARGVHLADVQCDDVRRFMPEPAGRCRTRDTESKRDADLLRFVHEPAEPMIVMILAAMNSHVDMMCDIAPNVSFCLQTRSVEWSEAVGVDL